jgi:hypothetical protein
MRSFTQPGVLARAGVAALLSGLACYPRLATWPQRIYPVILLWLVLVWAMFVLWGFVFAWQFQYANRPVFESKFQPKLWGTATLYAVLVALLARYGLDPKLRLLTPGTYPVDWNSWLVMGLFGLALEPLFLCFASFAFFIRLSRKQEAAVALTVIFGLLVLALRLNAAAALASPWLIVELLALRIVAGFVSLYFYLRGGALLVWWVFVIVHLRFIPGLVGAH